MRQKLSMENPVLVKEWDYEKNAGLRPDDFTGGSNKKVWWLCERGHSWFAQINKRFTFGRGCPYCSGNKVWPGFNDIATTHPHIAAEWDHEKNGGLRPKQFSIGADVRIWWKCKHGHSWAALLYSRKNSGCPVCAGNVLTVGVNDLLTVNPDLAAEWDIRKNGDLRPDSVAANNNNKAWWTCKNGHSWQAAISSRNSGKGCPFCNHKSLLRGFNDLATVAPEIATEWDYEKNAPLRPEMIMPASHNKVWWKCGRGHSWRVSAANRHSGHGCPYCAGKVPISGETDLQTLRPDLCKQWDFRRNQPLQPDQITACSNKKVWWICTEGHSFETTVVNKSKGYICPYCTGKRPILGKTDLPTVHPELVPEWDFEKNSGLRPENFVAGSHKKVWWRCAEGHSWKTSIENRHSGRGCPYCSGLLAIRGENDLATVHPELTAEWDFERNTELTLEDILPYSNKKAWWICKNGHRWVSAIGARYAGSGCPYCHGKIPMRPRLVR